MTIKRCLKVFFLSFFLQPGLYASAFSFSFNEAELETMKDKVKVSYNTHERLLKNKEIARKITEKDLNNFYKAFEHWFNKKLREAIEKEIVQEDTTIEGKKIEKKYTPWDRLYIKKMELSLRTSNWVTKKDLIDQDKEKVRKRMSNDMIASPDEEIREKFEKKQIACVMDFTFFCNEFPDLNCILRFLKNRQYIEMDITVFKEKEDYNYYVKDGIPTEQEREKAKSSTSTIVYYDPTAKKIGAYVPYPDDRKGHRILKYRNIEISPAWIYEWLKEEKFPKQMTRWEEVKKESPIKSSDELNRRLNVHYLGDIIGKGARYVEEPTVRHKGAAPSNVGSEPNGQKNSVYIRIGYFDELMRLIGGKGTYSDVIKLAVGMSKSLKKNKSSTLYMEAQKAIESVFDGQKTTEKAIIDFNNFIKINNISLSDEETDESIILIEKPRIPHIFTAVRPSESNSSDDNEQEAFHNDLLDNKGDTEKPAKHSKKEPKLLDLDKKPVKNNLLDHKKEDIEKSVKHFYYLGISVFIAILMSLPLFIQYLKQKSITKKASVNSFLNE